MNIFNRIRCKLGWLYKRRLLGSYGKNCNIGYNFEVHEPKRIFIGNNFSAGCNLKIEAWNNRNGEIVGFDPKIVIRDNVTIRNDCQISSAIGIDIGNGVLLGDNVFITDNFHGDNSKEVLDEPPCIRKIYPKGKVIIEDNVWIGRNVCIMPDVIIGKGSVIGANSVVTKNIPAYSIVGGVPARIIKQL